MRTTATTQTARLPWDFLALVAGYSCSAFGNYLNLIALSLYTLAVTGSPLGVGVVMALRLGTGFVTGLVAGTVVTRFDRRRLMIGTDLAQALAMVALALGPRDVVLLAGAAAVLGAGNTLFTVALRSSVPELVGQDERVAGQRAGGRHGVGVRLSRAHRGGGRVHRRLPGQRGLVPGVRGSAGPAPPADQCGIGRKTG
jgi:Na+/melibiose symporter-like transporter